MLSIAYPKDKFETFSWKEIDAVVEDPWHFHSMPTSQQYVRISDGKRKVVKSHPEVTWMVLTGWVAMVTKFFNASVVLLTSEYWGNPVQPMACMLNFVCPPQLKFHNFLTSSRLFDVMYIEIHQRTNTSRPP